MYELILSETLFYFFTANKPEDEQFETGNSLN